MDSDFKNLVLTVSQTADIGEGGVTVSWTGGLPSAQGSGIQGNFLQMMECYGSAATGPSPEGCEFGRERSRGAPAAVGGRYGDRCRPPRVNPDNPTGSMNGDPPAAGCDPYEPKDASHYPCTDTNGVETGTDCLPDDFSIPFVPEGGTPLYQSELPQAFAQDNTDEVDDATTQGNGTGQQQFETLTSTGSTGSAAATCRLTARRKAAGWSSCRGATTSQTATRPTSAPARRRGN